MALEIGRLTVEAVDEAWRLSTQAGWNQTRADWRRLLELCPESSYGGWVGEELVTTSTLATYGGSIGWIGMVLVDEDHRRRGYGSALFEQALERGVERGLDVIGLDATDAGATVYRQYDFETVSGIDRWTGDLVAHPESDDSSPVRSVEDPEDVVGFDRRTVGADRASLLSHLIESPDTMALVAGDDETAGYAIVRPGRTRPQVGPVVADGRVHLSSLLSAVADRLDRPAVVDALRSDETERALANAGLRVDRRLHRMTHGEPVGVLDGGTVVAATGFEWG